MGHIEPIQLESLTPPFPKWYNTHVRYDYHSENLGHPIKNYTAFRRKVQDLINDGKLKFEELDGPAEVEDPSKVKVEIPRQEKEAPKRARLGKAAIPKEKVPIAKVSSSSTTEGSKGRSCEPNGKEEKMML